MRLPRCLAERDDTAAQRLLERYYASGPEGECLFTGSLFDAWDSTGTRSADGDRFTADDLVAVRFLSVSVPARAAEKLLVTQADAFSELLVAIGPDGDLADLREPLPVDGPEWQLDRALRALPGIGPTTASKLFARKRPRLRPIYDSVVAAVLGTEREHWEPIRLALRADGWALAKHLERLRLRSAVPEQASDLRVLDVLAWMEGAHPSDHLAAKVG